MSEQPLDLRRGVAVVRRRKVVVVALVGLGLAVGLVLALARPPRFAARARVLLPPSGVDAQNNPTRDMRTEADVAGSIPVLEIAAKALQSPTGADRLRGRVHVRAVSSDILEVRAAGDFAGGAVELANAVATTYVAYSNGTRSDQANATLAALSQRAKDLDAIVGRLDSQIADDMGRLAGLPSGSTEAAATAASIDALRSQEADATRERAGVNAQIGDARLQTALGSRQTLVLERATRASAPAVSRLALDVGSGGLAGLVLGLVVALGLEGADARLRDRHELTMVVGAPVLASLSVPRHADRQTCAALLERWVPTVVEDLALRHACTRLGITGQAPANLVVIALAGDGPGLLLGVHVAEFAASSGIRTCLVVASQHPMAAPLRSAGLAWARSRPVEGSDVIGRSPSMTTEDLPGVSHAHGAAVHERTTRLDLLRALIDAQRLPGAWRADFLSRSGSDGESTATDDRLPGWALTVTVIVADGQPLAVPTWGRPTVAVLSVSSGFATGDQVAEATVAALDAGVAISGILVANPDPGDRTTGLSLAEPAGPLAPSAVLDQRAGHPDVPIHGLGAPSERPAPPAVMFGPTSLTDFPGAGR